jgi:lambda repressor-like predicted transcriptional regulator
MRAKEFIVEYKREVTLQKLGTGIATSAQREQLTAEQVIEVLERIDPTPNKQYVPWLAKQYINGQFRTEDADRVQETLGNFIKLKNRLPVEQRDVGRFDFYKLDKLVDELVNPELSTKQTQTSNAGTFPVVPNSQVLYNGPLGQLSIPETEEASCELGSGTKWCTASHGRNMYKHYSEKGPLYIWRDKSGDKFQFHFETSQFMDAHDVPIDHKMFIYFRTKHPVLKKLFAKHEEPMTKDPALAIEYAKNVLKGPFTAGEEVIASNADASYWYASVVLKKPWPAGEAAIAKEAYDSLYYARDVLEGPFPAGEAAIASDADTSYRYAREILKGPFKAGEEVIASDADTSLQYTTNVLNSRPFPAGEAAMAKNADVAYDYAKNVLKGQFKAGEEVIAEHPDIAYRYARFILKGPWPAGEAAIAKNTDASYWYAKYVLKGRFLAGEAAIAKDTFVASDYKDFLRSLK